MMPVVAHLCIPCFCVSFVNCRLSNVVKHITALFFFISNKMCVTPAAIRDTDKISKGSEQIERLHNYLSLIGSKSVTLAVDRT